MDKRERSILALTSSAHCLTHLAAGYYPGIVEPLRAEFGLNFAQAAELAFPGYLAFGICALPAGYLASKFSGRSLILIGKIIMAFSAFGAASAQTPDQLMYWLLGLGIGASIYHPVGYALLSNSVRARGRAHGIQGVFGNIGIAVAPLAGGVLSYFWSWRVAIAGLGAVALLATAFGALLPFDERMVQPTSTHQENLRTRGSKHLIILLVMALAVTFAGFAYRGVELLLPKHLGDITFGGGRDLNPLDNLKGSALAAMTLLVAAVGQMVGGRLADKIPLAMGYLLFHGLSLPFLMGLAYLDGAYLPVCAALYGFFSLGMQPFENSLVARMVPPQWRSIGYGVKFVLTFGVGSLSVLYVGNLTEGIAGTAAAMAGLVPIAAMIVFSAAALTLLDRQSPQAAS